LVSVPFKAFKLSQASSENLQAFSSFLGEPSSSHHLKPLSLKSFPSQPQTLKPFLWAALFCKISGCGHVCKLFSSMRSPVSPCRRRRRNGTAGGVAWCVFLMAT
jgi:hypothetical protein